MMRLQSVTDEKVEINLSNPYYMFKFSIRSEITRKYYKRRIKRFLISLNLVLMKI